MTPPSLLPCPYPYDAICNLKEYQRQLDMDGCEVGVSRQAVDEVLAFAESHAPQSVTGTPDTVVMKREDVERIKYYLDRLIFNDRSEGDYTEIWAANALAILTAAIEQKGETP